MENQTFLIVEATPNMDNKEDLMNYTSQAPVITKKHGGIPVAQYNIESVFDSDEKPAVIAILSFPNKEAIQDLLKNDLEYQKLIPSRDKAFKYLRYFIASEKK